MDSVSGVVGFPPAESPFKDIQLVISDCPITYTTSEPIARRKREVRQTRAIASPVHRRQKRAVITYDVNICDSIFSSSSLARYQKTR